MLHDWSLSSINSRHKTDITLTFEICQFHYPVQGCQEFSRQKKLSTALVLCIPTSTNHHSCLVCVLFCLDCHCRTYRYFKESNNMPSHNKLMIFFSVRVLISVVDFFNGLRSCLVPSVLWFKWDCACVFFTSLPV